jgi:hypothetical protein
MPFAFQRRRGTTAQHASFTGLLGELTVDTDKDVVVVHDGSTAGGFPLAKENFPINAQTGTSYTPVLADNAKIIELSNTSAITLTVPPNSSVAYPIGSQIQLLQTNTGQVTVVGGSGVTINANPGLKVRGRWSAATLIKRATDTWVLVGDITA